MLPMINRGTWARVLSFRQVILRFVSLFPKVNIVSLGAGYDSTYFWLKSQKLVTEIDYIEVDFADVIKRKTHVILHTEGMRNLVDPSFSTENTMTPDYKLISGDVRDSELLTQKMSEVNKTLPTLVLTECLLVYMSSGDTNSILNWLSETFSSLAVLNYEMINPQDKFGEMMLENLEARGCSLLGIHDCPTTQSQIDRMHKVLARDGFEVKAECLPMNIVYNEKLNSAGEKTRIEKLEMLDEIEEWDLLQSHYCMSLGVRDVTGGPLLSIVI